MVCITISLATSVELVANAAKAPVAVSAGLRSPRLRAPGGPASAAVGGEREFASS